MAWRCEKHYTYWSPLAEGTRCSHASHSLQGDFISQYNECDVSFSPSSYYRCFEYQSLRITILARDSVAYFVLVFGQWKAARNFKIHCSQLVIVGLVLAVADAIHTFIKFPVLEFVLYACRSCKSWRHLIRATVCIVSIAVRDIFCIWF